MHKCVIITFMFKAILVLLFVCFSIEAKEPYYVGELGSSWQFPSDHLPIGLTIDQRHIAFWNILNKKYLNHIEQNTQGLAKSSILLDNVEYADGLTVREMIVVTQILQMIQDPSHPRTLIALQETHEDVSNYLKKALPASWTVVMHTPHSQDIFLYDTDAFDLISSHVDFYEPNDPREIHTLTLQNKATGRMIDFVQSHIPGGPHSAAGCKKFAESVLDHFDATHTSILMGDMNVSPEVIEQALTTVSQGFQPYKTVAIPYPTHVNTHLQASWIDNFLVYTQDLQSIEPASSEQFALEKAVSVLIPAVR